MFKLRRRAGAAVAGSDLPYCGMCQQPIRIDAATGRCALGHRATTPSAPDADVPVPAVTADVLEPVAEVTTYDPDTYDPEAFDPYDTIVYGRSEYDYGIGAGAGPVAWDTPNQTADPATGALEDYATWGEPGGEISALDVDTEPFAAVTEGAQPGSHGGLFEALDDQDPAEDIDDATHARRKAVGTVAGTVGVSGLVFAAIAALPF